jgi:dimethylsulfoniopropionate demethylase
VAKEGPVQQIRPIEIEGDALGSCDRPWPILAGGKKVGQVTSAAWSPDHSTNVSIGMVRMTHWDAGTQVEVDTPAGLRKATVHEDFWA